jgi:predicted nuclease with TOPRIM domain
MEKTEWFKKQIVVCKNKMSYQSREDALEDVKIFTSRRNKSGVSGKKFRPYLCNICSEWHLSTK